ncbi:SH3 domain-containing protein [Aliiglaciecola sp. CAU 1673]|uniref:SH3 domain-containing protein n=1 Tax=Aliiglaciecola sp. CAU 1673 TaxID=3032595 RepID=UPI0023D98F80|nr:SH3 domain-containing protein [Aliiglaciecola sp. CAU 1673]MDF2177863.1 SH3 domain-containing protein [Aliiglaciecola sp. CAU 1673]
MPFKVFVFFFFYLLLQSPIWAAELSVKVVEPFADMRTGPASEYPVFHVVERGEQIEVLKQRTSWYKVRTATGQEGWISVDALAQTIGPNNEPVAIARSDFAQYQQRDFEFGLFYGQLEKTNAFSVTAAWVLTENIVTELSFTQALGDFSENRLWLARVQHFMFPEWRLSPYLSLGAGQVRTKPNATLVQSGSETRTSDVMEVGFGLRYYLLENFVARLEYKNLLALTDRDEQEELNEWKLGFSVFF